MTLEAYTAFLWHAYEVELPDLSFRMLVGLYTRVWGKQNLDPSKPLHIVPSKSGEECVDNLIKTFDRYATIMSSSPPTMAEPRRPKSPA